MKRHISTGASSKGRARGVEGRATRGFTLIELLMVTLIVGLLAGFALVATRHRARASLRHGRTRGSPQRLRRDRAVLQRSLRVTRTTKTTSSTKASPSARTSSFLKFGLRDGSKPALARVHIHIAHAGSPHYYHYEYPGGDTRVCRRCAGSSLRRVSAHRAGFAPRSIPAAAVNWSSHRTSGRPRPAPSSTSNVPVTSYSPP